MPTTWIWPSTGNEISPLIFTRYPIVRVFMEVAAALELLLDSLGALKIAEASGFELVTMMLKMSLIWMVGSGTGNLLAMVSSLISGK